MGRYPPQTQHIDTLLCSSDSVVPNLFYCAPLHPMPVVAMWRGGLKRKRPNTEDHPCLGPQPSTWLNLHGLFLFPFVSFSSPTPSTIHFLRCDSYVERMNDWLSACHDHLFLPHYPFHFPQNLTLSLDSLCPDIFPETDLISLKPPLSFANP